MIEDKTVFRFTEYSESCSEIVRTFEDDWVQSRIEFTEGNSILGLVVNGRQLMEKEESLGDLKLKHYSLPIFGVLMILIAAVNVIMLIRKHKNSVSIDW